MALFNIHESIEPRIPGSDANALSANLPNSCDRAFNLFFIHSLASPFLSLVVVHCDVGVDVLGPPSRASIRTPRVISKAVKIETIVIPCSLKRVLIKRVFFGQLFFLIYINDLVDDVSSDAKLFADDTSLFTVVYDETVAADQLNRDLKVITDWAYQWKMQFNPDINKQAVQVIFSQKRTKLIHPPLFFNDAPVVIKDEQKHLGMVLDSALNFRSHVREKIISARKGIGVIRYLSKYVSSDVLDQMYKLYVRPHLDYGDIIYHKFDPELTLEFTKKLETVQYSGH